MGFVTLLSFPYLQKMVGGTEAHQYAVLGAGFGVVAAVMTLACGLMTKERLKPVRAEKFSFKQFADLVKNKPWIYLTLIGVCTNFFNGTTSCCSHCSGSCSSSSKTKTGGNSKLPPCCQK